MMASKEPEELVSPRWNAIKGLVKNYLGTLYTPYPSVRKQLLEQCCHVCNGEFFEVDFLQPVAKLLKKIKDNERALHKRRKNRPAGWPLCSRGCLIIHVHDPDPSCLKPGDFYFVVNPVGVKIKWKSMDRICERSVDTFSAEMAELVNSKDQTHLLVAPETGITRIAVNRIIEELFENSRLKRWTRDSWVQTESSAPLASEEEFCSDTEQKLPEKVRQLNAIADLSEDALQARVAIMPGCRDKWGRSIVYVSLRHHEVDAVHLAETFLYFQSIPKQETMCLGFLVLVDGRGSTPSAWNNLHRALTLLEETMPGTVSLVLVLPSCPSIYHLKFESILNENQLLNYISREELLVEYGGSYHYDHDAWIQFHKFLDPFVVSCHQMGCRLVKLIQDLKEGCLPPLTTTLIEQQRKQIMDVLGDPQLQFLEEQGSDFLKQLEKWREKFNGNPDYEECQEKSGQLFKQLKKVVQKLEKLANKRLNRLQECMMVKMFEKESSQILTWLKRKGEETLKKHKTLAQSLNSIRKQEQEFEKFYFLAMRQIERGNDLLEEIPRVKKGETLKRQLDDFTERLEDAREKLEDTSRCYQLLDKVYEWCLETMRFVCHLKLGSTDSVELRCYLQKHPCLEFEEMLQLANKLDNPSLLQQCRAARSKFEETVELIQKRILMDEEDFTLRSLNDVWNPLTRDHLPSSAVSPLNLIERGSEEMRSKSLDVLNDSDRDWRACDDAIQRFADEIREQNEVLELKTIDSLHKSSDKLQRRTRCTSCSDFEELLSPPDSLMDNRIVMMIVREMIQTERDYVKSLAYIIENYVPLLQSKDICQALRSQRNVIFGNIEKIYEFHSCYFLEELEKCESSPYSVGSCFLKHESQFYLYALYSKNKPKSDSLMAEYGSSFFKAKQRELSDKMDLASYLLKPVQRMGKYALLLKQLLKECPQINDEHYNNLKAAEEMVRFQLRHGNDLLAMDALKECDVNMKEQGRLLRQDEFLVGKGRSRKALRRVFLFEDLIIFSKVVRRTSDSCYYQYKSSMKTSDLGLTAQVGESPTKFEIWFRKCKLQDLLVLQAPSAEIKNAWVEEITGLLWKQAERNRNLRLEEMSSMGVGNKPGLDITPSPNQICDRSISLQQLNKMSRHSVASTDNNLNELKRFSFYDNSTAFYVPKEESQCSAESGIFTDLSTCGASSSAYDDPKEEKISSTISSISGLS